jgi:translocation and assembly module TamB
VVYGREEAAESDEGLPIPLVVDVQTRLGDVRFEGLGIEAQLDGNLRVQHTAEGRWLVQGTSAIEQGTFSAYGQELVVEQGLLIFTGPPENPALDIRATRTVEDAEVGVAITGTARNPSSEVFSDTAISDSEALARLLTGRSLENVGEADPEALERAAIGLGLRRARPHRRVARPRRARRRVGRQRGRRHHRGQAARRGRVPPLQARAFRRVLGPRADL